MRIKEQNNNFQNSENETGQNFNGANIGNQNNYFLNFKFDWIFKKYKSNQISSFQFGFLFFSRFVLFILMMGLFLLPLYSVNKHNISFLEFAGMIIVFIFLCSWYWNKIKITKE